jgi:hypothetical protein
MSFGVPSAFVQVFGRRHDERHRTLGRPASKKRQGTKSREVGRRLSSERYENGVPALLSMISATAARADGHAYMPSNQRECRRHLGGHAECLNGRLVD